MADKSKRKADPKPGDGLRYVGPHPRARIAGIRHVVCKRDGLVDLLVGFPPEGVAPKHLKEQGCAGTINVSQAAALFNGGESQEWDLVPNLKGKIKAPKTAAPKKPATPPAG